MKTEYVVINNLFPEYCAAINLPKTVQELKASAWSS